jgi:ubiquinone/menaquinone biosynthesis C-methylase UbiE
MRVSVGVGLVACLAAVVGTQALTGVHPVTGRVYARTMSAEGAAWLERPEREAEERPDLAVRLLEIAPGDIVADIGAGSGYYTIRLARAVGPEGRVYANDIQPAMLNMLTTSVFLAKLTNVVPVLGTQTRPNLPAGRIDLAIMVDVYHEFADPQAMLQGLKEALRPGGRLALLEYRTEDPNVPILPDHKMTKAQIRREVEHEGFEQVQVIDDLPWQHLVIFRKP